MEYEMPSIHACENNACAPFLEVKDLHLCFDSLNQTTQAVRGASFSLNPGETVALVGASGSGKSALARSLMGLNPRGSSRIESGKIFYKGDNLLTYSEKKWRAIRGKEIAMVFQDPMAALNPTMRVGTQIEEGHRLHYPDLTRAERQKRILSLLSDVGIRDPLLCYKQYPHELSGGMRQRAMIATAVISSPKILLADEPTTALDVTVQAQILELLQHIQREHNTTILLITHDLSIAAQFCDRILVMYGGKIVESAPKEKLFQSPKHPYTRALLRAIPKLHVEDSAPLEPIPGSPPDLSRPLIGCSFCPRCSERLPRCAKESPLTTLASPHHSVQCWLQGETSQ